MFRYLRELLEMICHLCIQIEKEVSRIERLTKPENIVVLIRIRAVARQLFEDITEEPVTTRLWGTLPCERQLLQNQNPFWKSLRMGKQLSKGFEPKWDFVPPSIRRGK